MLDKCLTAISLNLNTNLCNWGIIRVLLALYVRLSGLAIAMRSGNKLTQKDNADSGVKFITPVGPKTESPLSQGP